MIVPTYETSYRELERITDDLRKQYNRLLELCMYSLIRDTKLYNGELDDVHKLKYMDIIRKNLNDDTFTLRKKILEADKLLEEIE